MRSVRLISAVLLLVQSLTLVHLAEATHSFDELGGVFEHETLAQDSHDDEQGHVCADVGLASNDAQGCPVLTTWRAAAHAPLITAITLARPRAWLPPVTDAPSHPVVAPLFVAPKASPPVS